MIIRDARPEDYASAAALEQEIFMLHYDSRPDFFRYRTEPLSRERYEKMLEAGYIMLLVEEDERIVGQAIAMRREYRDHPVFNNMEWFEIDDISVSKEYRGRGIGRMLFQALKERARESGLTHIELTVWGFNAGARAFYTKMGMRSRIDRLELDI